MPGVEFPWSAEGSLRELRIVKKLTLEGEGGVRLCYDMLYTEEKGGSRCYITKVIEIILIKFHITTSNLNQSSILNTSE